MAWHFDPKGVFSVKSAYHVLEDDKERLQMQQRGESSSGGSVGEDLVCKRIWKLSIQPKTKHFLWRLSKNSLPWRCNIQRRGMQIDTRCPVCGRLDEDGGHCFLKCKYVKHCWAALGLEHVRSRLLVANSANQMVKNSGPTYLE